MVWVIAALFVFLLFFLYSVLPNILTRWLHWFALVKGPTSRSVALTFDDGPDPEYTPLLLNELAREQIVATFFVLAERALEYPDIIRRMVEEGHDVQIHGWTHGMVPFMLPAQSRKQFIDTQSFLKAKFGLLSDIYRPTWGLCNLATLSTYRKYVRLVTWSVMVGDWRVIKTQELHRRVMKKLHPGAIIVLHDSDKTPGAEKGAPWQVIGLIAPLAKSIRAEGYTFCLLHDWYKAKHL